jgi:hypothetical protein
VEAAERALAAAANTAGGGGDDGLLLLAAPPPPVVLKGLSAKKRAMRSQGKKKDPRRFSVPNKYKSGKQNRSDRRSAQRNTSF